MINSVVPKHLSYFAALTVLLLTAVSIPVFADSHEATTEETFEAQIQWVETVEEATKQSTETGKPIMMDFYTDW
jgi:thiol:disulfide interchange protein